MFSVCCFLDARNVLVQWTITTPGDAEERVQGVGNKSAWRHGPRQLSLIKCGFLLSHQDEEDDCVDS